MPQEFCENQSVSHSLKESYTSGPNLQFHLVVSALDCKTLLQIAIYETEFLCWKREDHFVPLKQCFFVNDLL